MNTDEPQIVSIKEVLQHFGLDEALRRIPDLSPCNSPIENIFYYDFQKRIKAEVKVRRQVECKTPIGIFYLDFVAEFENRRLGFECDGRDYHQASRDAARDRAIIQSGYADRIYRLRGHDLFFRLNDLLDLIRIRESRLFSERGQSNIEALASN